MSLCGSRKGKERIFHPSGERSGARIPFFPFRRPKSPGWSPGASGRNGKGSLAAHRGGRRQAILFRKMAGDEEKPGGTPPFPRHPKKKTGSPAKTEGDGASSGAKMRRFRLWMKNLKGRRRPARTLITEGNSGQPRTSLERGAPPGLESRGAEKSPGNRGGWEAGSSPPICV